VAAQGTRQENTRIAQVFFKKKAREILIKFQDKEFNNEINKFSKKTIFVMEEFPERLLERLLES
jgi:hypothetical protein